MIKIPEIQYITRDNKDITHAKQAKLMYENGIQWVQLRMKNYDYEEIVDQALEAMDYANYHKGILIINDSVDIAIQTNAHGVHLGLADMPIEEARKLLGNNSIIGATANTVEDVINQASKGADYIGLGPFRYTTTKINLSPVIGLEGYQKIMNSLKNKEFSLPIVAVGGISEKDIQEILNTGIDGVAISAALLKQHYTF